jgi:hypothetical protein
MGASSSCVEPSFSSDYKRFRITCSSPIDSNGVAGERRRGRSAERLQAALSGSGEGYARHGRVATPHLRLEDHDDSSASSLRGICARSAPTTINNSEGNRLHRNGVRNGDGGVRQPPTWDDFDDSDE